MAPMKMTVDLPDDLVRQMKVQAAKEGRKLKDVAEQVFRRGLTPPAGSTKKSAKSLNLPLVHCRHKASARSEVTPEKLADVLLNQELLAASVSPRR